MSRQRQPSPRRLRRQQRERKEPRQSLNVDNYFDVHVRVGLDDDIVRLAHEHYQKLILQWQLGGEDVILRGNFNNSELQVILRGTEGGRMRVSRADSSRKIPLFEVFTTEEIMMSSLSQNQEEANEQQTDQE